MARKIERLFYINERGDRIEFSTASVFHCNTVTGLSDVRNTVYSTSGMSQDGDTFVGHRIESRDIEIIGGINARDKDAIQRHRRELNRVLNPQYKATLTYEFGADYRRVIDVKINNAPVLSREVIFTDFALQLIALSPFWRRENETRADVALWIGDFEFPIDLPAENWEIGHRQPSLTANVYNDGDVQTGVRVVFTALGEVVDPALIDVRTQEFLRVNMTMQAGDTLTVTTGYGEKAVTLMRGGVASNAFRYLDPDSTYLQLAAGDNILRYDAAENLDNLEVAIYHNDLYLGV